MVWWWGGQVLISSLTVACVEGKWEGGKTKGKREGKSNPSPIFPSFLCPFWLLSSNLHLMVTRSEAGEKPAVYLWARRGAHNRNLQVFITHASHVCSQHSFGPPLWMNGMYIMQFDQTRLDLLPLVIWSLVFWPSFVWNLSKVPHWGKSFWTSDCCRLHLVTFGYYQFIQVL